MIIITACGPSAAEKELFEIRAMKVADSIAQEFEKQQAEEANNQMILKAQAIDLKAQIAGEEVKMESIKDFSFLRTKDEKSQQVAAQTIIIENLKEQLKDVEKQITD